jgi:Fe-S-cluster containining protein
VQIQVAQSPDRVRAEAAEGLLYCHSRLNAEGSKLLESCSFLYGLVELLVEKNMIALPELEARKRTVAERLMNQFLERGMGVALQKEEENKYEFTGTVELDCENRIELCHAACCRMSFALSRQDVEEGIVKWDLGRPYLIAQDAEGYCRHLERESCQCTVREHRPLACRAFDCRNDKRIWADFKKRIINPHLEELFTATTVESAGSD